VPRARTDANIDIAVAILRRDWEKPTPTNRILSKQE